MWVKKTSIRPVPSYAKIHAIVLAQVRAELIARGQDTETHLDSAFKDFEAAQPVVASRVGGVLNLSLGEEAIALGFFLSLAVWMAFDRAHGAALGQVTVSGFDSTKALVELDESLRREEEHEALETDDVIAMEQPEILRFIHEHMAATLELRGAKVDPSHLSTIYRFILIEVLSLSYAVRAPIGFPDERSEALA